MARLSIKNHIKSCFTSKTSLCPQPFPLEAPQEGSIMYVREETLVLPILVLDLLSSSGRH